MAHRKAGGTAKNLRDSKPKYLGIKVNHGETALKGGIIVRQRGTRYMAGQNVGMGVDHSLFAKKEGVVSYKNKRKENFDGKTSVLKIVSVQ